jgi:hypothetical protein
LLSVSFFSVMNLIKRNTSLVEAQLREKEVDFISIAAETPYLFWVTLAKKQRVTVEGGAQPSSYLECGRCCAFNHVATKRKRSSKVRSHSHKCKGHVLAGDEAGDEEASGLAVAHFSGAPPLLQLVAFASSAFLRERQYWASLNLRLMEGLESSLFKAATASHGVFFYAAFRDGPFLYTRYFETGAYRGFFSTLLPLLEARHKCTVLPLAIFSSDDIPLSHTVQAREYLRLAKSVESETKKCAVALSLVGLASATFRAEVAHVRGTVRYPKY